MMSVTDKKYLSGGCSEDAARSEDLFLLTEDGYSDRYCVLYSLYSVQCQGGRDEDTGSHSGNDHISLPVPCQTSEATISPLLSLAADISFIIVYTWLA